MAISATSSPAHTLVPQQTAFSPPPLLPPLPPPPQLIIPLDDDVTPPAAPTPAPLKLKPTVPKKAAPATPTRRELLQSGKEGSRRRQRWENDHFISNPHFVPPTKSDWEPRPLYPRRIVPYQYASLWEHPSFPRRDPPPPATAAERVPKELKNRLKKSHGALALLEALEREVREFLLAPSEEDGMVGYESSIAAESEDSEEDEIVFVSRRERGEGVVVRGEETKVLFQSKVEEDGASFGRWLVHSIAGYYGLQSWSVTAGNPPVRYAYVAKTPRAVVEGRVPKPLYLMV